ncbi:MAG: 2-hydroxyacid dehydrogenase [Anaerolineae bacterium]
MPLHAHIIYQYPQEIVADLRRQLSPGITVTVGDEVAGTTQVLIDGRPTPEQLAASPHLTRLIIPWAGLPAPTRERLAEFPHIAVHNLHHNAAPTAEMAVTLLLAAAKWVVPLDQSLRRHDWTPRYQPSQSVLLAGKTAVILGYGAIGQQVARFCRALDMKVLATRRRATPPDGIAHEIHAAQALPKLLPRADALLICLPHTPETDGLIGTKELALLPPTAVLVNIGRGAIVEQKTLYEALRDGRLHAAGLDVWYNYPLDKSARAHTPPADYPFHELENVVLSPHRGGDTMDTNRLRMAHLARMLNTAVRGEPMPNRVDLQAGY